jgi:DNA-binding MarR family transcriptional regulator
MSAIAPGKTPSQSDVRVANQLLGLFPWMGRLWSTAMRDAGAGSPGRFKTLGQLHGRGPIRAGELAVLCGLTPSATTEVIEGLVADGFVRRVDDPTDRRAVMIGLTAEGSAELERLRALLAAAMARVFDGLTPDQKARLRVAVAELNDILIVPSAQKETRNVR